MTAHGVTQPFATSVSCQWCGAEVPIDVRAVEVRENGPVIACPRCATPARLPTFGVDAGVEGSAFARSQDDAAGKAENEAPVPPPVVEPAVPDIPEPVQAARVERRRGRGREPTACRACGAAIPLASSSVRLWWTHASTSCPSCGAEVRVRRQDAFRTTDHAVPWTFTCYREDEDEEEVRPDPAPARRLLRRMGR